MPKQMQTDGELQSSLRLWGVSKSVASIVECREDAINEATGLVLLSYWNHTASG
jgi:hypothetical protein